MSVFMIKQVSKPAEPTETATSQIAQGPKQTLQIPGGDVDNQQGENTQLEPQPGAEPGENAGEVLQTEEGTPLKVNNETKDTMIKIDGPVGRIFTDALNKVLAQESYVTMLPAILDDQLVDDPITSADPSLQVYCWTGDALGTQDVVKITNDIAKHQDREYVIAVESAKPTAALGILSSLDKLKNVKVCFSREAAMSAVLAKVKR